MERIDVELEKLIANKTKIPFLISCLDARASYWLYRVKLIHIVHNI